MKKFVTLFILSALFLELTACGTASEGGKTPPRVIHRPTLVLPPKRPQITSRSSPTSTIKARHTR